jgi:hypothetical protein
MSRMTIAALVLLALILAARLAATFLEILVLPRGMIRIAVMGVVSAALVGAATYILIRTHRSG